MKDVGRSVEVTSAIQLVWMTGLLANYANFARISYNIYHEYILKNILLIESNNEERTHMKGL